MCQKWIWSLGSRVMLPRYRLLWNLRQATWQRKLRDLKRTLSTSMSFTCHYHAQLVIYNLILKSSDGQKKLRGYKTLIKYWHLFVRNNKLNTFKSLESSGESKDCTVQAAKRQRLERGHLSKVLSPIIWLFYNDCNNFKQLCK